MLHLFKGGLVRVFALVTLMTVLLGGIEAQSTSAQNVDDLIVTGRQTGTDPIVEDFTIQIDVPADHFLTSVELTFDDIADAALSDADTRLVLFQQTLQMCSVEGVATDMTGFTRYLFKFPLPLWLVGQNRLRVWAKTTDRVTSDMIDTVREIDFYFSLPSVTWGIGRGENGRLGTSFQLLGIPMYATECGFVICKDADQDGLLDLWENIAVEVLHPVIALDEAEKLFNHPTHHLRTFVRVAPFSKDGLAYILFLHDATFSRDYGTDVGPFVVGDHNGDTQPFELAWRVISADEIQLERMWADGHHCDLCSPETTAYHPNQMEFTAQGIITIFAEEDKHGIWPSQRICDDDSGFDCKPNSRTILRPSAYNSGEPPASGRPFIDHLNNIWPDGPYPDLAGIFPSEAIWSLADRQEERDKFCGGLGPDGDCAGQIGRHHRTRADGLGFVLKPDDNREVLTLDPRRPNPPVSILNVAGTTYISGSTTYIGLNHSFTLTGKDAIFSADTVIVQYRSYEDGTSPGAWQTIPNGGLFTLPADAREGVWHVDYRSLDPCHSVPPETASIRTATYTFDRHAPATSLTVNGVSGNNGWLTSNATLILASIDPPLVTGAPGSGLAQTSYSLDGGFTWSSYSSPLTIAHEGINTILYRSLDRVGNQETVQSATVKIDKSPPSVVITSVSDGTYTYAGADLQVAPLFTTSNFLQINYMASDTISGIFQVRLDNQVSITTAGMLTLSLPVSQSAHVLVAEDMAGHLSASFSFIVVSGPSRTWRTWPLWCDNPALSGVWLNRPCVVELRNEAGEPYLCRGRETPPITFWPRDLPSGYTPVCVGAGFSIASVLPEPPPLP